MAMLPLQDLEASARELDRAIELGARAITVGAHSIAGRELYDEDLWPLYARMAEAGLPLFVHPYPFALVGAPRPRFGAPLLDSPYPPSLPPPHLLPRGPPHHLPPKRA